MRFQLHGVSLSRTRWLTDFVFSQHFIDRPHPPTQPNDSSKNAHRSRRLPSEAQRTLGLRTGRGSFPNSSREPA